MKLENLKICFENAKENESRYVGVKIWMYGFEECEIIINPTKNFEKKLEYYQMAYNEDLTLKAVPDKIKIVGVTYGDSYGSIEKDLLGISHNDITVNVKVDIDEYEVEKIAKEAHEKLIKSLKRNIKCSL